MATTNTVLLGVGVAAIAFAGYQYFIQGEKPLPPPEEPLRFSSLTELEAMTAEAFEADLLIRFSCAVELTGANIFEIFADYATQRIECCRDRYTGDLARRFDFPFVLDGLTCEDIYDQYLVVFNQG